MADNTVLVERVGGVTTITLNRPEVLNATDAELAARLEGVVATAAADGETRAIVLTGAGKGFCAGGDMRAAWRLVESGEDPRPLFDAITRALHATVLGLRRAPKPVVAAINGAVGGIGLSLAAACDLRLIAAEAKLKVAYPTVGLTPDGGWTATVARLIGPARAAELLLLDPLFDAARALELGLVHEVVPGAGLQARTRAIAERLAAGPPGAFAAGKALLHESCFADLETVLERERLTILERCTTAEFHQRLRAFMAAQAGRG